MTRQEECAGYSYPLTGRPEVQVAMSAITDISNKIKRWKVNLAEKNS